MSSVQVQHSSSRDIEALLYYWHAKTLPTIDRSIGILFDYNEALPRRMTIHDMRQCQDQLTLDSCGFQVVNFVDEERNMTNEGIQNTYYPEVVALVKKTLNYTIYSTGALHVQVFNHDIRDRSNTVLGNIQRGTPSLRPHSDFADLKELPLEKTLFEHYANLFQKYNRWEIITIWRPLKPVKRSPFIIADATSIPKADLVFLPMFRVSRTQKDAAGSKDPNPSFRGPYILRHGSKEDQHRWYYLPDQQPTEGIMFRQYDSNRERLGWCCAHTSIELPDTGHLPPRSSIEIRVLAFFE